MSDSNNNLIIENGTTTNVADVLENCNEMLASMLPNNIEVHLYASSNPIPVACPAKIIENTLVNIAYHALRLLSQGGYFVIVASLEHLVNPDNEFHIPAGQYCKIICSELHAFPQKVSEREHALANESLTRSIANLLSNRDKRLRFTKLEGGNNVVDLIFN
ncbi:MAG: hypothetical protein Q4F00_07460 [bacterium]|nr:hypothetical protein [bacterium]